MSLQITGSPDISVLSAQAIFDVSGVNPLVIVNNLSEGDNLANVSYAFIVISPTTTFIHEGTLTTPDETGIWSQSIISSPWPRPFNNIEFGIYKFQILAKDSDGNEFAAPVQTVRICRPNGNLPTSQNPYGLGSVRVETKCDQARIYFQDETNTSYQGLSGTVGSAVLRVNFPMDNTGTVPAPFEINYFSGAMVPITYTGKGYQFLYTSIYQYDFDDETAVRIKYLLNDVFGVWCGIDLMPLICEYQKLIDSIEAGSCADSDAAQRKLMLINPKFSLLMIGILQPLTGVNVPELIAEIEEIGGFDCDCCNVASGVVPAGSNAFDGYTFSVVSLGGDVGGSFVQTGLNIQLRVSDVSYIFKICEGSPSPTTAFSVVPSVSGDGFTKTYCLNVDVEQLAADILNAIKTDQALVNLFNSIVVSAAGSATLLVDGKCIFNSSTTYGYQFTLEDIPVNTSFGQMTGINIDGVVTTLAYAFNMTGLPALQAYLNTLGYGTFTVAASGATTVIITSTNNSNNIDALIYANNTASAIVIAAMVKTPSGFIPLTTNQVVQEIIDYLCTLNDGQVITSAAYEICWVDSTGTKQTETIAEGVELADFLQSLVTRGCTTIDYIISLGSVNCQNIKAQFPTSPNVMQANDYFLGTKENACAQILPTEAFLYMLTYGQYNAEVLAAFCNMVTLCGGGLPCEPYDVFYANVDGNSPTDGEAELVVFFDHPSAVSNTIRYARIDNTVSPVYTTITGVLPGQSPYAINGSPGVENGQYRIGIKAIYADGRACPEVFYDTLPCTGITAFSAGYDGSNINITYTANAGVPFVKVNLSYPNGGSFTEVYANGATISITPPTEVYGTFFATMQPVCDNDSGWFGAPTAQASFEIPLPYTVIIQVENPGGGNGNRITDILGVTGFTLPATVTEGNYKGGYHGAFTGQIVVKIIQVGNISNNLHLLVNDAEVDCLDVPGNMSPFTQTYTFQSSTFAADDVIRVVYNDETCSP